MSDLNGGFPNTQFPDDGQPRERRNIDVVVMRLESLHSDVSDMKDVLKELTVAINRLALVEERQSQTASALERAFVALKEVEARTTKLELSNVTTTRAAVLMDKVIWAVIGAVIAGLVVVKGVSS
jgi:hypothetical protein